MYTGVSGLQTYGNAMNVTGDNIANVNTVGFRGNRAVFADILANQVANGATNLQFGRGAAISDVSASFSQGSFETTGNATDMAIQGAGFFVVRNPGFTNGTYYTRAGQFILDQNGKLSNANGYYVQGYQLSTNTSGAITRASSAGDIDISGVQSVPKATSTFKFGINLDAAASAGATFATSMNVYNAVGEPVTITYTFTKSVTPLEWTFAATGPAGTVLAGTGVNGTATFSATGQLTQIDGGAVANQTLTISGFPSGAQPLNTTWTLVNGVTGASLGELTSYASDSVTNSVVQDGYSTGVLRGLSVDGEGIISGLFSNGQTQQLYQVQLADFLSPWGLTRSGDTLFGETAQSGQPIFGVAKAGGFGSIYGSALEMSNVDLSEQFVTMIQNQRAYQANSRIVTTVDQMLQEVVNLVR
ncbi:MAG: flagellar hook protein FlgE [Nitrospinae bacterium]|nr:flagellar hook protein FlgE [Nitrospinota bacterium]